MSFTVEKYLARRSAHRNRPLEISVDPSAIHYVVVIPALAEYDHLFETLDALGTSSMAARAKTLVICVINNADASIANPEDKENNRKTLTALQQSTERGHYAPLMVAWIDACSEGCALPPGEGVGLSRKIGLDHGLHLLARTNRLASPLINLDADAPPAPGFLDAVIAHYENGPAWAGYAAYLHRLPEEKEAREAVISHEIYMRYHEMSLFRTGSPYAYPALGSIISCTGAAYAASGGMNRRLAGEDFYFMQQLAKTGSITPIAGALVYPSGRSSRRTPFGTGRSVLAYSAPSPLDLPLHHPAAYDLLHDFFSRFYENPNLPGKELLLLAERLHPQLAHFLIDQRFESAWDDILGLQPNAPRRRRQFHVWFDGLRTIQLLHHLRDTAFPDLPAREALAGLFQRLAEPIPPSCFTDGSGEEMLHFLRIRNLGAHLPATPPIPAYYPDVFHNLPATS